MGRRTVLVVGRLYWQCSRVLISILRDGMHVAARQGATAQALLSLTNGD
jgi:hypothetical protein